MAIYSGGFKYSWATFVIKNKCNPKYFKITKNHLAYISQIDKAFRKKNFLLILKNKLSELKIKNNQLLNICDWTKFNLFRNLLDVQFATQIIWLLST